MEYSDRVTKLREEQARRRGVQSLATYSRKDKRSVEDLVKFLLNLRSTGKPPVPSMEADLPAREAREAREAIDDYTGSIHTLKTNEGIKGWLSDNELLNSEDCYLVDFTDNSSKKLMRRLFYILDHNGISKIEGWAYSPTPDKKSSTGQPLTKYSAILRIQPTHTPGEFYIEWAGLVLLGSCKWIEDLPHRCRTCARTYRNRQRVGGGCEESSDCGWELCDCGWEPCDENSRYH